MDQRRITPKQKMVLDYIESYGVALGYAPTQQEIAERFGFKSLGTVQNYLVRLERQGFLSRVWNGKRAMSVVKPEPAGLELPMVGYVAAGRPIEAVVSDDSIEIPPSMIGAGENFVLKVKGDSMVGDGIMDGDYVVVKRQQVASNGQTVVALVDNEATVKHFFKRPGGVTLVSSNPLVEDIEVLTRSDFRIEGVVVGVIRHCT